MSAVDMAELAFARRERARRPVAAGVAPVPLAPGLAQPPADNKVTAAMKLITTYIPTEVLTLYVAAIAIALPAPPTPPNYIGAWVAFWVFLAASPIVVWIVFAAKQKAADPTGGLPWQPSKWPTLEMLFAALAFVAWAAALPSTPFAQIPWYSSAVAGLLVLITSTVLGLVASLV